MSSFFIAAITYTVILTPVVKNTLSGQNFSGICEHPVILFYKYGTNLHVLLIIFFIIAVIQFHYFYYAVTLLFDYFFHLHFFKTTDSKGTSNYTHKI